jgi:hypothetical protein
VDPVPDTHYSSENLVAPEIEPGISGSVARNSDHRGGPYRANTGENGGRQKTFFPETTSRMEIFYQISEDMQYHSRRSQYLYVHTKWKVCTSIASVQEATFTAVTCYVFYQLPLLAAGKLQ